MSTLQRKTLARVIAATHSGEWYRAQSSGERVTLASLYIRGLCVRRAWRKGKSSADNAYEYQTKPVVQKLAVEVLRDVKEKLAT